MWLLKIFDPFFFFTLELSWGVTKGAGLALLAEEKTEGKKKRKKKRGNGLGWVWGKLPINILKG